MKKRDYFYEELSTETVYPKDKISLRKFYAKLRKDLSLERKVKAAKEACKMLYELTQKHALVLSFSNAYTEIDLVPLNQKLAQENRLVLPKVTENHLCFYLVTNCDTQLQSSYQKIKEPIPSLCIEIVPNEIEAALIPGLAFDTNKNRLGYGKGHYDRSLSLLQNYWGIGFKEQLSSHLLPVESHDQPLQELYLF